MMRQIVFWCATTTIACGGSSGAGSLEQYDERLDSLEGRFATWGSETDESVKRLEGMIDILQAEVSKPEETEDAQEEPAQSPEKRTTPNSNDALIVLVNSALGVTGEPVTRDGENVQVDRGWFTRNLETMLMGKKPALSSDRNGGIRMRGIRTKSFLSTLGLKSNDVVIAINDELVNTAEGLSRELSAAQGPELRVKLLRKKTETTYTYTWK